VSPELKRRLLDMAAEPYRLTGGLNYRWARGKLRHDPMFVSLLDQCVFPDGARVLDLGCGRGLLPAWFLAAEQLAVQGGWSGAVAPPRALCFHGVELIARDAECGNRALRPVYGDRLELTAGDVRNTTIPSVDVVAMLDVLHYLTYAEQDRLLDRIRAALRPGNLFVTRVGNADSGLRCRLGQLGDGLILLAHGHRLSRTWCRPVQAWAAALEGRGFAVLAQPMSHGTPFANVMLIARVI
jgi:SAM-dependent methyltransferase